MKRFRVSQDEPESSSDGSMIEALDAETAAEIYVIQRWPGAYDYAEACEVWVREESSLEPEEYTVTVEAEPVFRATKAKGEA